MSLFTKAPDLRGPRERPGFGQAKNWMKPAQAVVQLSRHMVQALPWNASPLLQIPGMAGAAVTAASKRGRSASGPGGATGQMLNFVHNVLECPVGAFDAMRAVPGLKDMNEKRLGEVRRVCESITDIRVECRSVCSFLLFASRSFGCSYMICFWFGRVQLHCRGGRGEGARSGAGTGGR